MQNEQLMIGAGHGGHGGNTMLPHALRYANRGWPVFPLVPNAKKPLTANGFNAGTTNPDIIRSWWTNTPTANIGVCTGSSSGLLVLDVDIKNGQKGDESLLNLILSSGGTDIPRTLSSSTPSGGMHYYFRYPDMDVRCSASLVGPGLDIRASGGYIVAPPSVIDGRYYNWENSNEDVGEVPQWLVEAVLAKAGVRRNKPYGAVREGQRNNHIFQLACGLRAQGVPQDIAEGQVLAAAESCDPPLPQEEAIRSLQSAYRYDPFEPVNEEIRELNKRHAMVMMGGKCRIMNFTVDPNFGYPEVTFSTPQDFRAFYANKSVLIGTKEVKVANSWLESPLRRQYEGVVFCPGSDPPPGFYNLWHGFSFKPQPGDCSLLLDHIRENIASGDEEVYKYIIAWMADAVQRPSYRPGTALVFRGKQGTGKGIAALTFGSLFGKHYVQLTNSGQLLGRFNAHLGEAVVVFADEAFWGGDKSAEGHLKAMVTEQTHIIEKKNMDSISALNFIHLIIASNNEWVVPAGLEERRFLVLDVSDRRKQDHAYFEALLKQVEGGGREAFLHYLMHYDLNGVNLRVLPRTNALLETKLLSMPPVHKFWYSLLRRGTLEEGQDNWNDGLVLTATLRAEYIKFATDMGVKRKATGEELGMIIGKLVPSVDKDRKSLKGKRRYSYLFPPLEECRRHFDLLIGAETDWSSEADDDLGFD